jgi:SAM-dependent methyltransferase
MAQKSYDATIADHYRGVATETGLSPTSTMADEITRTKETDAIVAFVGDVLRGGTARQTIVDVGCGNGFTLSKLAAFYPGHTFIGVEQSDDLRGLADSRFHGGDAEVRILAGDIRDADFLGGIQADVLVCQRVLINLLDPEDQKQALGNIVKSLRPATTWDTGGSSLFIECFKSGLARLNEARDEFGLPPIPPAHHNLYLDDDFFAGTGLVGYRTEGRLPSADFLSTHYFVTRVLHPILLPPDKPFTRNSHFVRFFTEALREAGDFSPLKLLMFRRDY